MAIFKSYVWIVFKLFVLLPTNESTRCRISELHLICNKRGTFPYIKPACRYSTWLQVIVYLDLSCVSSTNLRLVCQLSKPNLTNQITGLSNNCAVWPAYLSDLAVDSVDVIFFLYLNLHCQNPLFEDTVTKILSNVTRIQKLLSKSESSSVCFWQVKPRNKTSIATWKEGNSVAYQKKENVHHYYHQSGNPIFPFLFYFLSLFLYT